MFEFFIALFGGAYYGGKIAVEQQQHQKFEKWNDTRRDIDIKLGNFNRNEIFQTLEDSERRWNLLNIISEDLKEVFGDSWKEELNSCEFARQTDMRIQPWGIVYHIILSKKGAIDTLVGRYNLDFVSEFQRNRIIKAGKVLERNIRKRYPQLSLVFCPQTDFVKRGRKVEVVHRPEIALGTLCWSHHIGDMAKAGCRRLW